jgi:hypothetical protein
MTTANNTAVNSVRKIERRTYTPITLPEPDVNIGGVLDLAGLVRLLNIQPAELTDLQASVTDAGGKAVVGAIGGMLGAVSGAQVLTAARALTANNMASVQEVGQALATIRTQNLAMLQSRVSALHAAYLARDGVAGSQSLAASVVQSPVVHASLAPPATTERSAGAVAPLGNKADGRSLAAAPSSPAAPSMSFTAAIGAMARFQAAPSACMGADQQFCGFP